MLNSSFTTDYFSPVQEFAMGPKWNWDLLVWEWNGWIAYSRDKCYIISYWLHTELGVCRLCCMEVQPIVMFLICMRHHWSLGKSQDFERFQLPQNQVNVSEICRLEYFCITIFFHHMHIFLCKQSETKTIGSSSTLLTFALLKRHHQSLYEGDAVAMQRLYTVIIYCTHTESLRL